MGWNKIANIQKSKIIYTYSGQQFNIGNFFPQVTGNWMVMPQVSTVYSNSKWVSGVRAISQDLGNYNFVCFTQCSNAYISNQFGTVQFGTIEQMTSNWLTISPNETKHIGYFKSLRGTTFGWSISVINQSLSGANGRIILRSDRGDIRNFVYNSGSHHLTSIETPNIPYDTNLYIVNAGNKYIKVLLHIYQTRWENCDGICSIFISESRF